MLGSTYLQETLKPAWFLEMEKSSDKDSYHGRASHHRFMLIPGQQNQKVCVKQLVILLQYGQNTSWWFRMKVRRDLKSTVIQNH